MVKRRAKSREERAKEDRKRRSGFRAGRLWRRGKRRARQ
jgi:hypothetical protein